MSQKTVDNSDSQFFSAFFDLLTKNVLLNINQQIIFKLFFSLEQHVLWAWTTFQLIHSL